MGDVDEVFSGWMNAHMAVFVLTNVALAVTSGAVLALTGYAAYWLMA